MKAWEVTNDGDANYGSVIVFAPTISEAKKNYKTSRVGHLAYKYVDLRVKRLHLMDDKENLTEEELTLFLLNNNWERNGYAYIEDGVIKGYVTLRKCAIDGIKAFGLNLYLKAKLDLRELKLSEFDYDLLRHLPKTQEWLARNKDGTLVLFDGEKPYKDSVSSEWLTSKGKGYSLLLDDTFVNIVWNDDEPFNIKESLLLIG